MNQHSPRLRMHPYAGFLHLAWPPPDIPVMASVILVPVVPVALVAEAVRPVPGPISPAQIGDDDTRGEVLELPRAARERCVARARHPIEVHMTERDVVARSWWNERYVSDDRCSGGGVRIDNFGADGDLLQGRYRERAEPAREARVLVAVLLSVEGTGTRGVLAVVVRIAAGGNHAEIVCLAHRCRSILCATTARRRFQLTPAPTVPDLKRKGDSDRSEPPLLGTHGFRLVQTDLMGNSEYCAEKSCRSTIHHSRTTGTQRTERQLLADAVYRPCCYDHLQKLDKSPSPPVSLVVGILRRTAHPSRRGQPQEKCGDLG